MRKPKISLREYAKANHYEHLIDELVVTDSNTPDTIGYSSAVPVDWECAYGHRETESPNKRVRRGYCSVCGPNRAGSFGQNHPELLKFWSPDNTVDPYQIPPTYTPFVKWRCKKGHQWNRRISLQLQLSNCPVCAKGENALFSLMPELLEEWDTEKNSGIEPNSVPAYGNKKYYWKCENGHSYTASPAQLMRRKTQCPICASFGFQHPEAVKEWHPTKNTGTPFDYSANSQKTAWFICSVCGKEYESRIAYRAMRTTRYCPNCRKKG